MSYNKLAKFVGAIVEIEWEDAYSIDPWTQLEELHDVCPLDCLTLGIVSVVTPELIAVSGTVNAAGDVCSTLVIPRGMVRSVKVIRSKKQIQKSKTTQKEKS